MIEVDLYFHIKEIKEFARDEVARRNANGTRGHGPSESVHHYVAGFFAALDLIKDSLVNQGIKLKNKPENGVTR